MMVQELILETLYTCDDANIIRDSLSSFSQSPILADWFVNQDPEMLEVAARMFQYWGKRSST